MRTDKEYRACSLFLGKRSFVRPKCCSWKKHKSTPQRTKIIFGFKWETTFLVTLGWHPLAGSYNTPHSRRLMSSSKWVEYAVPFHSKKLSPHILEKREAVLWGCLGKNVLWWVSSHLNKREHSKGLPTRTFSGWKVEKPPFSSLGKPRVHFLKREMTLSGPEFCPV